MADETALHDFPSLFSLKDKVIVVTGGSRGLGLNAASALHHVPQSQGLRTGRRPAQQAAEPGPGARAISVPADSATMAGIESLLSQVQQHTSHVDVLFANAGATWGEKFDTHPDSAFAKVMDLNVKAVFNTIRLFAPLLQKRASVEDPSRVLITASVAGLGIGTLGQQATFGYSASKAAVLHLGRNLAVELGPRHITVNSICPGFFPTKMANGLLEMSGGVEKHAQGNPMKRLGRPEDIAGIVVYLSSRAGSHVNGAAIELDGGAMWARGSLADAAGDEPSAKL
ncbi:oxidoreductase [Apiospora kogelbergensis]|uniref:oxidoreductase n=1 Tax=Apiospora kogelbergensis TaxID=1337665 RepID=UPI00312E1ACB